MKTVIIFLIGAVVGYSIRVCQVIWFWHGREIKRTFLSKLK